MFTIMWRLGIAGHERWERAASRSSLLTIATRAVVVEGARDGELLVRSEDRRWSVHTTLGALARWTSENPPQAVASRWANEEDAEGRRADIGGRLRPILGEARDAGLLSAASAEEFERLVGSALHGIGAAAERPPPDERSIARSPGAGS